MKTTLAKDDWLMAQQCIGMAWHAVRTDAGPPDEAARFRMQQGQEVHARARDLFPGGAIISGGQSNAAAAAATERQIRGAASATLFEATVLAAPFVARADVLTRLDEGWHLLEVKSSFPDTKEIKDLVDDLAYTTMVFQRAALPVARASLALLKRDYQHGDEVGRLFDIVDKTGDAIARAREFDGVADKTAAAVFDDAPPRPVLSSACRDCAAFDVCLGHGLDHTVLELPGLHAAKLKRLSEKRIVDIALVPDDLGLTDMQVRARRSAVSNQVVVDAKLGRDLAGIEWPCHYLDFETVATVLPLYPERKCHEQVLTQFSIHHRDAADGELRHSEHLADAKRDGERELAQALIAALGASGSVLVYSGFEKTRIKALQARFPDLAGPLAAILERVVDLLQIVKDHVYHPDFRGSFSIKSVLPALVSSLSYDGLAIANGDAAIAAFARMARGEIAGEAAERTRRQLLEYCATDSLAMVRLHDSLLQLAG